MKAINKRQHIAIVSALCHVQKLQAQDLLAKDSHAHISYYIKSLKEKFIQYEALLAELSNCIIEYDSLYKESKVNILGPAMRQARKQLTNRSIKPS